MVSVSRPKLAPNFLGGNSVESAAPGRVKDFVAQNGGHTVITSVLIANNGIAAVKEIRSIRKWAYETFGDEKAIQFVVMATPDDLKVNAEYIRMADQYVEVPGGSNNHNYANVPLIVDIAERMGVHAVWAGWGHASENPKLPESLAKLKNRVVFIGPPGSAMRSLGDKISSTIVAQSAKVPCVDWSGVGVDEVLVDDSGLVTVADEIYHKACTHNAEEGLAHANRIGYPIMIKASEGGGGKGIRKVDAAEQFVSCFSQVMAEVPGSPIFVMKMQGNARHLEVQLLADQYGTNISLFGRDCSVQRRHQKIIEEAPVTIARPETFTAMEKAAVRLGKLVGYVSAGTVEYLYSHADDKFYFLELNPRLQVEHPTTEMVTGVNLPAAQLQIAMGLPLHRIRDIRLLYGVDPSGQSEIDFEFSTEESTNLQRRPTPKGHTTACRITSEDPGAGFKPSSGIMTELNFRSSSNVWGYFSVSAGGAVHQFSDSQFGHIFAYGENRSQSRKHMVVALKELSIRGEFRTTVEYLIKLLETPAFEDNTITTGWLDTLISNKLTAERPDPILAVVCGAVTKAHIESESCLIEYRTALEKGQIPSRDILKTVFPVDFIYEGDRFRFTATRSGTDSYHLFINGSKCAVGVRDLSDGGLLVLLNGGSHTVYYRDEVGNTRLSVDGKTCLLEQENDPTQLRSPSPGKLAKFLVESGEHVKAGQAFAEVEVMKMYMPLIAQEDGIVQLIKQPGSQLEAGEILGILSLDDPSKVKHAKPFDGQLPAMGLPVVLGDKPTQRYIRYLAILNAILDGYDNQVIMASTLKDLQEVLRDPSLPYGEWETAFAALSSRTPPSLDTKLSAIVQRAQHRQTDFPARQLSKIWDDFFHDPDSISRSDAAALQPQLEQLPAIANAYKNGLQAHEFKVYEDLLTKYWATESLFSGQNIRDEDVILRLRDENKDDVSKVVQTVLSHARVGSKNNLILAILGYLKPSAQNPAIGKTFGPILKSLSELDSRATSKVALKAREVLIQTALPSLEERHNQMELILKSSVTETTYGEVGLHHREPDQSKLKDLIDSRFNVFDVLPGFFIHPDDWVKLAALEVYVRRSYRAYSVVGVEYHEESDAPTFLTWKFNLRALTAPGLGFGVSTPAMSPGNGSATPTQDNKTYSFKRVASVSDMSYVISKSEAEPLRTGAIVPIKNFSDIEEDLHHVLEAFPRRPRSRSSSKSHPGKKTNGLIPTMTRRTQSHSISIPSSEESTNVLNVVIMDSNAFDEDVFLERVQEVIADFVDEFDKRGIRRVTFTTSRKEDNYPRYYTFRGPTYLEDPTIRHIEPALAFQLELSRLSNFNFQPVFTDNRNVHVYKAEGKDVTSDARDVRFFVRAVVRPPRVRDEIPTSEYLISETDRLLNDILDALQILGPERTDMNHIFINFTPTFELFPEEVEQALGGFIERFGRRMWRLRISVCEVRIICKDPVTELLFPLRVIITNVSGFVIKVDTYAEIKNDKGEWIFKSFGPATGPMHLRPITTPYPTKEWLQPKRYKAHIMGTTYVYDFPELFSQAIRQQWQAVRTQHPKMRVPDDILQAKELIFDEFGQLIEVEREPGTNSTGMVAWLVTAKTPEYPKGRRFVIIANDITHQIGSFGPAEDKYFFKVTELARRLGIPRIYLSANSGARIGIAEELIPLFSVAWKDASQPTKGFDYLYLTEDVHRQLEEAGRNEVITERIVENGEVRHKITTIIGAQDGLGVECLRGSGLIAGATSRAYEDIFTITLVTCRSVGIGAYLVRLGQRAIQIEGQPIILTGAGALNKVLGREVYSSNLQLGGTQIMYNNGVSHITAKDDLHGVSEIMNWLSFVPEKKNAPVPISPSIDDWDRDIEYTPPKGVYDVRWLLEGKQEDDMYLRGFFDRGSFREALGGWAKTVVVGRARLGGIPMGVIAVETRTIENVVPADPANPDSVEQVIMEAGQVWYPNSAFKTAQAINDFNRGEQLPLIIFANWRGFSGGQRDMFNEVLKYGSYIVDALVKYEQPIFVYIPPFGELRGGSWVVVDPTINEDMMEMYADVESRAGVLEPEGIVGLKFRREKILSTMARLDPVYASLKRSLEDKELPNDEKESLKIKLGAREKALSPIYQQITIQFADLHDRSGRMKAKGVIRKDLEWRESRRFFYWRLRRRLNEQTMVRTIRNINSTVPVTQANAIQRLKEWYFEHGKTDWEEDDRDVATWLERDGKAINAKIDGLKSESMTTELLALAKANKSALLDGMAKVFETLSAEEKDMVLKHIQGQQ